MKDRSRGLRWSGLKRVVLGTGDRAGITDGWGIWNQVISPKFGPKLEKRELVR